MQTSLSHPPHAESPIRRAAVLFAGGPAPAANAVISATADSFMRNGIEMLGIMHGYSGLAKFGPDHPMREGAGQDYIVITPRMMRRTAQLAGYFDRHGPNESWQGRFAS